MGRGAMIGMGAGAVGGTAIGGPIGGLAGAMGGYALGGLFDSNSSPQAAFYNYQWGDANRAQGEAREVRADELALAQALQAQAAGQGPSIAQDQLRMAQTQAAQQANAQAASAQGGALASVLAQRNAINAQAQTNQQSALASALARSQEQLGAQQQLGSLYGQVRQGDMSQQQMSNDRELQLGEQWQQMEATRQRQRTGEQEAQAQKETGMMGMGSGVLGGVLK